jgi:hypothetical protein
MIHIIGLDFDNTLVSYDDVIYSAAVERGLIPQDMRRSKNDIRNRIRLVPDGEIEWQRLQALVYGPKMGEARLIKGVQTFFGLCKRHKVRVYIISHKTEFADFDETGINLRIAALAWMRRNKFFEVDGLGLSQGTVYFESTRREKIERIKNLGCTHFIDDLEETFLEENFPKDVEKILYAPYSQPKPLPEVKVVKDWQEINEYFFSGDH